MIPPDSEPADYGIDYGQSATPFVDAFAHFCAYFPLGKPLGINQIGLRGNPFLYSFLQPCAELWVRSHDEPWLALRRHRLDSLPWCASEQAVTGEAWAARADHVFADERRLVSYYTFTNTGPQPVNLDLQWRGRLPAHEAVPDQYLAPFSGLRGEALETFLDIEPNGITGGWRTTLERSDYPQAAFRLYASGWTPVVKTWDEHGWPQDPEAANNFTSGAGKTGHYALTPAEPLQLAPGESHTLPLIFDLAWAWYAKPDFDFAAELRKAPAPATCIDTAKQRHTAAIGAQAAPLPPSLSPHLRRHLMRARHALLRNGYRGQQGEFGDEIVCFCTSDAQFFSTVFFWDSLFSAAAIADFNPTYARGAIAGAFTRQDERDGSSPENKWNYTVPQRHNRQYPQAPVGSWATAHYLQANPNDKTFLSTIYPTLRNNHRYWADYADADGDGLAEWRWSGQTADDSPLYDPYVPGGEMKGCQWLPPIASVSLNCFLYRDADLLEQFARRQGHTDDAAYYAQRKTQLHQALMDVCFVEADGRFWDYNHATRTHRKVRTFYLFWPLFARLPLPDNIVRSLIEEELLNPQRFFGPMPFPSVAYDEPSYDPTGYWRGKAWPQIAYWLLETLVHYGYRDAADEAAARMVSWYSGEPGFPENMETHSALSSVTGHLDYNWGIAAFSLMAQRRYLCPDPLTQT